MSLNEQQLSAVLVDLARTLVADFSIQEILDRLVDSAVEVLDIAGAGVLLIDEAGRTRFVAASSEAIGAVERIQSVHGEGPCLSAFATGERVMVSDLSADRRYPEFSRRAAATGIGAVCALPLTLDGRRLGSLDLYVAEPRPLTEEELLVAEILTDVTAVYLFAAQAREDAAAHSRELRHQALHDALTGLPNRALFRDRLEHAQLRHARDAICAAVLFIDVDRFKAVNDAHGHHVGDELLVRVAGRLSAVLRPGDTLARLSGDEFVVLCEDLQSTDEATAIAERVVQAMAVPLHVGDQELHVGLSVGVATTFEGPEVAESLLLHADAAMYRAKRRGGGQFALGGGMGRDVERRRSVVRDLREAIVAGALDLHYQRIVDAADGRCVSVEALLRWHHPDAGEIPPPLIVDVAESTGTSSQLTSWVLDTAVGQLGRWREESGDDLTVAVNVTALELTHPRFVDAVGHALAAACLPGEALCLEITESTLLHDVPAALEALAAVRRLGVGVAIDDFGTGYSSLSYLKRFPVQAIKIDRSFVSALASEPVDRAIVRAIVQLAETLELTIVAEGVETEAQLAVVDRLGCHRIQGYLFSTPRPAAEVFASDRA